VLTTGTFDPIYAAIPGNWYLGGANVADLSTIDSVVISNGNTTATITVLGVVGANPVFYNITMVQDNYIIPGFTVPVLPTDIVVSP
jgi:hypothetical protein